MEKRTPEQIESYIAEVVQRARVAQKKFEREFKDQRSIDAVVRAAGMIVVNSGKELAMEAVGETSMGDIGGKLYKMNAAALSLWNTSKGCKSVGVIEDRNEPGVRVLCKPMGVVGCVMPSTNPIATVIGNAMMNFKCRNAVIIAAHPSSAKSSNATANLIRKAVAEVGAPEDIIQCVDEDMASIDATMALLRMCDANIGTGGAGMVKAVYSSGKPAFGVGQGNCQVIVDEDYPDFNIVAASCVRGRAFDRGVPCIGDQTMEIPAAREAEMLEALRNANAYVVEDPEIIDQIRKLAFPEVGGPINRKIVGRSPQQIGEMLGIDVPESAIVLCVKNQAKGIEDDLCREILCPILRYTTYETFEEAIETAVANLEREGAGHSSAIWSKNDDRIMQVAEVIPVCRFNVEQPAGGSPMNGIPATTTIGCGTWGGNSISENLQWYHLYQKTKVTTIVPGKKLNDPEKDWDIWE